MRLGTKTRDARAIAETLAELGASINFGIGDRYAYATFSTLTENLDAVMALMSDMLFNPTLPAGRAGQVEEPAAQSAAADPVATRISWRPSGLPRRCIPATAARS